MPWKSLTRGDRTTSKAGSENPLQGGTPEPGICSGHAVDDHSVSTKTRTEHQCARHCLRGGRKELHTQITKYKRAFNGTGTVRSHWHTKGRVMNIGQSPKPRPRGC